MSTTPDAATRTRGRVLIIGRSPSVIEDAADELRRKGFRADATNQFDAVLNDYDIAAFDIIVFGGMVPPDTKERLTQAIAAANQRAVYVQGMAGIAGVIAAQVEAATTRAPEGNTVAVDAATRVVQVRLENPAQVAVDAWWVTSFTPPEPASTSLSVHAGQMPASDHSIALPGEIPPIASFITVTVDSDVWAFTLGAMPPGTRATAGSPALELPPVRLVATHHG